MHANFYCRCWPTFLLVLGLAGCRPAPPESHLSDTFLARIREAGDRVNGRNQAIRNSMYYVAGTGGNRPEDVAVVQTGEALHQFSGRLCSQIDTLNVLLAGEPLTASRAEIALVRVKDLSGSLGNFETRLFLLTKQRHPFKLQLPAPGTLQTLEAYLREGSVAAARVALAQLRAEVVMAAQKALEYLASKLGSGCCMCFTRITPVAAASSAKVQAGSEYEAELFLGTGHRSGWYARTAVLNGQPLSFVRDEAVAVLPVPGSTAGRDSHWQLDLHVVSSDGRDSTLVIHRSYPVTLPASFPASSAAKP